MVTLAPASLSRASTRWDSWLRGCGDCRIHKINLRGQSLPAPRQANDVFYDHSR